MEKIKPKHLPQVENKICEIFGVERSKLFEKTKLHSVVSARRTLLYILLDRGYTHSSLAKHYKIGRSSTYHALSYIPVNIKYNRKLRVKYQEAARAIRGLKFKIA